MIRIDFLEGGPGGPREFNQETVNIGRAASNDLVIDNPFVSSEHAQIYISGDRVFYSDLNSTNGSVLRREGEQTFFKGEKHELLAGDVLVLGGKEASIAMRVVVDLVEDFDDTQTVVASRSVTQAREIGEQLRDDAQALGALFHLVRDLASAGTRTEMLEQIAERLLEAYDNARLATVFERQGSRLLPVLSRSVDGALRQSEELPAPLGERLEKEQVAILTEVPGSKTAPGTGTALLAPLLAGERLAGALRLEVRQGAGVFGSRDLDLLTVFAAHASKSLQNMALLEALRTNQARLAEENQWLRQEVGARTEIIGEAPAMKTLRRQIEKVVPTDTTVLVLGETGTGKELVARAIHNAGPRRERLFAARNCGAIPENLIESEFFGHVRGAFTGATDTKRGVFDLADGGTVFLDEIGELPLSMQVKLLRVLQEGEILPVGSTKPKRVDVRIISATNRDLETEVREGRFREDLFYRLNVFPIRVPALRERREDIGGLALHFLRRTGAKMGRTNFEIDEDALEALRDYHWPGNVRELENEIERAAINAEPDGPIRVEHLSDRVLEAPAYTSEASGGLADPGAGALKDRMIELEKQIIRETLDQTAGNRTHAAELLGISRQAFMKKIAKYGIR